MDPETLRAFCEAERASVLAPAGCGKTETIARAAVSHGEEPVLILTHTHAGVSALRKRLQRLGTKRRRVRVETIAAWALRFNCSYPTISRSAVEHPRNEQWADVYDGALRIARSPLRRVLKESYASIYVDEYQDCTLRQHNLIQSLAESVPCKVLGDPLQGIFDFGSSALVDWAEVESAFPPYATLTKPWRWASTNSALGSWLTSCRADLLSGNPIDLRKSPIEWRPSGPLEQLQTAKEAARRGGRVVALLQWPGQCITLAQKLKGRYGVMEPIESGDLQEHALRIDESQGPERVTAVLGFCAKCMTGVQVLNTIEAAIRRGSTSRIRKRKIQLKALEAVGSSRDLGLVATALECIAHLEEVGLYRYELFDAMKLAATRGARTGEALPEAAWQIRNATRQSGRVQQGPQLSRTLLVKGLEYDHVAVLGAHAMDQRNLYVALTRASRSVLVVSNAPVLNPCQ